MKLALACFAFLAPLAAAHAQIVSAELPIQIKYGGDMSQYAGLGNDSQQFDQCTTLYLKKNGSSWAIEQNSDPQRRSELLKNDELERLLVCAGARPKSQGYIFAGSPVPVYVLTTYFFAPCGGSVSCEVPYKSSQFKVSDGWVYHSRLSRSRGYVAVNSAFLDQSSKDRNDADWVDYKAVVAAVSQPELLNVYRDLYVKSALTQAQKVGDDKNSLRVWSSNFSAHANAEAWAIVTPKLIAADALTEAREYISPSMLAPLKEQARAYWTEQYRTQWGGAKTMEVDSNNLAAFKELANLKTPAETSLTFKNRDYDNLIPLAKAKLEQYAAKQDALAAAEQKARIKAETARIAEIQKQHAAWRKGLKVGAVTNCGPVIEIKGTLLKIYAPVKDYGNEHWINRGDLYMPGERCSFLNGAYQPPYPSI
jgi:hypothetical protein